MSEHKREVEKLRQEILQLDEQLTVLLEKRARAARSIGEAVRGEPPLLPLRDRAFVEALVARSKGDLPPDALRAISGRSQAACGGWSCRCGSRCSGRKAEPVTPRRGSSSARRSRA